MTARSGSRAHPPHRLAALAAVLAFAAALLVRAQDDPLPSWNDGAAKQAILDFVDGGHHRRRRGFRRARRPHRHLRPGRHHLGRASALRPGPVRPRPPGRDGARASRVEGDRAVQVGADRRPRGDGEVHREGLDGDRRRHPRRHEHGRFRGDRRRRGCRSRRTRCFERPVTDLVYQPMLEVMDYLRANGFRTYIVTGGGQEFVRVYTEDVYGVPPEQVVGSSIETKYEMQDGKPVLMREPKVVLHRRRRRQGDAASTSSSASARRSPSATPTATARCWNGRPAGDGARLGLLVLHDDAEREFAYGPANGLPDTSVGTSRQALMDEAKQRGWTVISMKNDWGKIFMR